MENLIQNENKMIKSFVQGIHLFGIVFIDVLVVFLVTYFFDVENFFTNGGLKNLKSTAITIRFGIIITIWIILLIINYIKAKKNGLFNVGIRFNKTLYFFIPLAIVLPIIFTYFLNDSVNFTVIEKYKFFINKSYGDEFTALLNTGLQYIYWSVELLIVIFIIDSFDQFGNHLKVFKIIPWGGIGLAFTWGLEQLLMRPHSYLHIFILSMFAGILYQLSKRNFIVLLVYFIVIILIKG